MRASWLIARWCHEVVLLSGTTVIVKVAHVRLCHSRMLFVRAYPRETQEMVFDAHDRAFALFKGTLRARHLRQHEDGGGDGLRRQRSPLQSSLPADAQPLPRRSGGLRTESDVCAFVGMQVYPLFRHCGFKPEQQAMSAIFEDLCRDLRLSAREDAIRNAVAQSSSIAPINDALLAILLHRRFDGASVVGIRKQKLLLLKASNDAVAPVQRRISRDLRERRERKGF